MGTTTAKVFKFGARSRKNLEGVHGDLDALAQCALSLSPVDFTVTEGRRTIARQRELYETDATQTMDSRHITGHAIDVAAWVGGVRWDFGLYYQIAAAFQAASKQLRIPVRWGGAWARLDLTSATPAELVQLYVEKCRRLNKKPFLDGAHFELPASVYPSK